MSLWEQHKTRYEAGGVVVRHITYLRFRRITDGILTDEELAALGRLNAKKEQGASLTAEETARMAAIASKWPILELKAACFVKPTLPEDVEGILDGLTKKEADWLDSMLERCIVPDIPEEDITDPLAIVLVASGGLGIDIADMTVGQGMAVVAMLTPKKED